MPVDVFALDDDEGDARRRERLGRWLMILGVVIAAAGCIVWVYVILRERGVTDDDSDLVPGVSAPVPRSIAPHPAASECLTPSECQTPGKSRSSIRMG